MSSVLAEDVSGSKSAAGQTTAISGQGETHHFSFHVRRAVACGHLRPEAAPDHRQRQNRCRLTSQNSNGPDGQSFAIPWSFKQYGQCGTAVSELFPMLEPAWMTCASSVRWSRQHQSQRSLPPDEHRRTGLLASQLGSWLLYGLGSENQNLPDSLSSAVAARPGRAAWSSSFLPAAYQGTLVTDFKQSDCEPEKSALVPHPAARATRLLKQLNTIHQQQREEDNRLSARIESFELAFGCRRGRRRRLTWPANRPKQRSFTAWTIR